MKTRCIYIPFVSSLRIVAFMLAGCSGRSGDTDIDTDTVTDADTEGVEFLPDGPEPLFRFTGV
jgi:hypothetical protein